MKAIVYHRYGSPDVLDHADVEKPTPGDDEVLIQVRAASLNPLDWRLMHGGPFIIRLLFGLRKPRIGRIGRDVAGQIEAVGRNVTRFKPGDAVFGACRGACAEYACAAEGALALKPAGVTFEQAASAPVAALTALQGLRDKGWIQAGQKVLINGAAGGVGTFAVQIARSFRAEVTGVCSPGNVAMVRAIGADHVIDYTREDFTRGRQRYDLILDCIGNHPPSAVRRALNPRGRCVMVGGPKDIRILLSRLLKGLLLSRFVRQTFVTFMARITREDLARIGELLGSGQVTAVIDRVYGLREVPEAIRYLEGGHARGKVVIVPEPGTNEEVRHA
jgi:NADPH:quinone reductase-like Zn-dependent oxidoreductase